MLYSLYFPSLYHKHIEQVLRQLPAPTDSNTTPTPDESRTVTHTSSQTASLPLPDDISKAVDASFPSNQAFFSSLHVPPVVTSSDYPFALVTVDANQEKDKVTQSILELLTPIIQERTKQPTDVCLFPHYLSSMNIDC